MATLYLWCPVPWAQKQENLGICTQKLHNNLSKFKLCVGLRTGYSRLPWWRIIPHGTLDIDEKGSPLFHSFKMYLFLFYEFAHSACMSVCVLLACRAHGHQGRVSGSLEQELSVAVNLRVGAWNWPESILHKPATALSHRAISSALVRHSSLRHLRDKENDRHRPVGSQTQQQLDMCKTSPFSFLIIVPLKA